MFVPVFFKAESGGVYLNGKEVFGKLTDAEKISELIDNSQSRYFTVNENIPVLIVKYKDVSEVYVTYVLR